MEITKDSEEQQSQLLDFSGLILGFSSAALYHIGETEVDEQKTQKQNFELAQQNISIIKMLQKKTKGNLSTSEEQLLETIIKDLEEKFSHAKQPNK